MKAILITREDILTPLDRELRRRRRRRRLFHGGKLHCPVGDYPLRSSRPKDSSTSGKLEATTNRRRERERES